MAHHWVIKAHLWPALIWNESEMDNRNNSEFPHLSADCELASLDGINLTNQIYSKSGEQNTRTSVNKSDITYLFSIFIWRVALLRSWCSSCWWEDHNALTIAHKPESHLLLHNTHQTRQDEFYFVCLSACTDSRPSSQTQEHSGM